MTGAFDLARRVIRDGEAALFLDGVPEATRTLADAELRLWSFVSVKPVASYCYQDGQAWLREGESAWRRVDGDAWGRLREFAASADPFPGSVAGFVSYEAGRLIERLPSTAEDDTRVPDLLFFRFDGVWAVPADGPAIVRRGGPELRARESTPPLPLSVDSAKPPMVPRTAQKDFEDMVLRAQAHVRAGDVFQVNLSHRLETTTQLHPLALYARLRDANPAPFSAYFASGPLPGDAPEFFLLSSSPERLFRLHEGRLEARPIAGTRRREASLDADDALVAELRADPKEQAEHVMLVDLARNDLGRVARYGSVRVPRLLTVESYRTVHHLVSVVEAELDEGKDAVDALVALFPGGTITGAPKVRAMEIIEALEPVRRGAYTGSLGWLDGAGDADFNILIRTLFVREGKVHLQVGAGIVEESVPTREYEETLAKAKGLLRALGAGDAS